MLLQVLQLLLLLPSYGSCLRFVPLKEVYGRLDQAMLLTTTRYCLLLQGHSTEEAVAGKAKSNPSKAAVPGKATDNGANTCSRTHNAKAGLRQALLAQDCCPGVLCAGVLYGCMYFGGRVDCDVMMVA